jgi:cell division septum initiation protein DivIVA
MGADVTGENGVLHLLSNRSLPVGMRGYEREATDRLLSQVEQAFRETLRQHAAAVSRADDLERRIAEGREREEAVTDALVVATQIRSDSEREGKQLKAKYLQEAETEAEASRQRAAEVVREAESQAEAILEEARSKARGFQQEIREAEQLAVQARTRLRDFLESLLAEIEPRGSALESAVDDLLARAGQLASDSEESSSDRPGSLVDGNRFTAPRDFGSDPQARS